MIIKSADDNQSQIAILRSLLTHPNTNAIKKKQIEQEIRNIDAGKRGEEESAYELKVYFGENKNWMVIHDLRIEYNGLVAQIDHLIINRFLEMWVCESKHFSEGIAINEHGEFSALFRDKPYGVASPVEQNNKHILLLNRLFDSNAVKLPTRLGFTIKPNLKSLVLVSKKARIERPNAKVDGLNCIVKNDQAFKTIRKAFENNNPKILVKIVSQKTLETLAKEIAKLHKPIQYNWEAKFGLSFSSQEIVIPVSTNEPQESTITQPVPIIENLQKLNLNCDSCSKSISNAEKEFCERQMSKFGGKIYCYGCQKKLHSFVSGTSSPVVQQEQSIIQTISPIEDLQKPNQKFICVSCNTSVTLNVAKFCWVNKAKFGSNIYCIECQKKIVA